ncbi:MAG: cytochrome c oxidase subunit II [Anaerolineaceae bacterium]|nr:MAG: cytochrome c oxidase subunit II [Anaerolineaceae bacterium]
MRHFVIAGILVILAAILTYLGLDAIGLLPIPASAQAMSIDWLWNWEVITISFLFALIVVPLVYSLVVFRRKKGDTTDAEHIEGNTKLEIAWTIVPLFIVMAFAYMGAYSLAETRRADPQAMVVNVTATQWAWSFEYPDYGFSSKELRLPKDKQVLLRMESKDVIHSFWVPEFRVKQDIVPGRVTELRITPTVLTAPNVPFKVRCAELCGTSHYSMEEVVIVSEEADFVAWATEQQTLAAAAQTPEARGQQLVVANGCLGCHSIDGSALVGPTWLGVFGREEELSDGAIVVTDEAYITESILDPQAKIVAGYETQLMPVYTFTEEQLVDIIAYLKTLK